MNNRIVKIILQLVLVALIVFLGWRIYNGIMTPIEFNKEKDVRFKAVIERLIDIRKAEVAYKDVYGEYVNDFGKLIYFVKNDSFPAVKKEGVVPEELIDSLGFDDAELYCVELGMVNGKPFRRDTIKLPVRDSLYDESYNVEDLRYIPFTDKVEFELKAGQVKTASQVTVKVFEASATNDVILHGMNEQLLINLNDEKIQIGHFPGLKVGDINQANNNAGNWE